jgi:hypothetical protein
MRLRRRNALIGGWKEFVRGWNEFVRGWKEFVSDGRN